MRPTTTGRRTHQERSVILGHLEDGPNLVTMAMNSWADGEPASQKKMSMSAATCFQPGAA
jgi:hypothetical protein